MASASDWPAGIEKVVLPRVSTLGFFFAAVAFSVTFPAVVSTSVPRQLPIAAAGHVKGMETFPFLLTLSVSERSVSPGNGAGRIGASTVVVAPAALFAEF